MTKENFDTLLRYLDTQIDDVNGKYIDMFGNIPKDDYIETIEIIYTLIYQSEFENRDVLLA